MALNLNLALKKKGETAEKAAGSGEKKILNDVRVFVALMVLVSIGLIVASVFGAKANAKTLTSIDEAKTAYQQNQLAIANLKALQSKSSEYEAQRDEYEKLIPNKTLDQQTIMIEMEKRCDNANCVLTDIDFADASSIENVTQMPVTLSVTGDFNDIVKLCQNIVTSDEFMRIDVINMKSEISSGGSSSSASSSKTSKASKSSSAQRTAEITVIKFAKAS